jgi:hypothetical protein
LSVPEVAAFERDIVGFLEKLMARYPYAPGGAVVTHFYYDADRTCIQFLTTVPVRDESWYSEYLRVLRDFSRQYVRILSFQGFYFDEARE